MTATVPTVVATVGAFGYVIRCPWCRRAHVLPANLLGCVVRCTRTRREYRPVAERSSP